MPAIDVPTIDDSTAAAQRNPLQQFVYMWSPAALEHSEPWRRHLAAAIEYVVQQELGERTSANDSARCA
jgi:hypothetical protein